MGIRLLVHFNRIRHSFTKMSVYVGCFNWDRIIPKWTLIANKLARAHQDQHVKHLEYLKDEISLDEKETEVDEDVIDAVLLTQEHDGQIKHEIQDNESSDEGIDDGFDSTPTDSSDGESVKSEQNKVEIYLKPMDESLSLIALDGDAKEEHMKLEAIVPLAFTALI